MSSLVVIASRAFDGSDALAQRMLVDAGCDLVAPSLVPRERSALRGVLRRADAVVASDQRFDAALLHELPALRVIARTGVGVDSIDLDAATRRGILVTTTEAASAETVADHVLALMLAVLRGLALSASAAPTPRNLPLRTLHGAVVGIVGFGRIGRRVARRLLAFGAEIRFYDHKVIDVPGVRQASFDDLLETSDVLSLHVPLTAETAGLISAARLSVMKPSAVIVNTARGGLVDTVALVEALREGAIGGAGLDVASGPPGVIEELRGMAGVVMTPHVAWSSVETRRRVTRSAAASVAEAMRGRIPATAVNPQAGSRGAA
jgi:D-3-phosphoglycerate dehydrogenase